MGKGNKNKPFFFKVDGFSRKKKKSNAPVILVFILIVFATVYTIISLTKSVQFNDVVTSYTDSKYKRTLHLVTQLHTEIAENKKEKLHFYKIRSIYKYALELNKIYKDELKDISIEKKSSEKYESNYKYINEKLQKINKRLHTDYKIFKKHKQSVIISIGREYSLFISRYNKNNQLEDLDYEILLYHLHLFPKKSIYYIKEFYKKYNESVYVGFIIEKLLSGIKQNPSAKEIEINEFISLYVLYLKRYPTAGKEITFFICTGNKVNLRKGPGVHTAVVGKIKKDEIVLVLNKSMSQVTIYGKTSYWYKITNLNGNHGWLFGSFLQKYDINNN